MILTPISKSVRHAKKSKAPFVFEIFLVLVKRCVPQAERDAPNGVVQALPVMHSLREEEHIASPITA